MELVHIYILVIAVLAITLLALEKAFDIRLAAAPASQASDIAALVDLVDSANS